MHIMALLFSLYLTCSCVHVADCYVPSWGRAEGRTWDYPRQQDKAGKFVRVFFTRSAVFIFCFFGFKEWALNCKGNMND